MDTLASLLEHAERERNAALAAFNQARARRDAAREQGEQLHAYRLEHDARWQSQFKQQGAGADIVRCHQQFGTRLDTAIAQQAHAVSVCEAALARANDTLTAHELRVASVRKLLERRASEAAREVERRERKDGDELATRMASAQRHHTGPQVMT